jgi:flagellar biosynthesis anti-sigma factor FlgM
MKIEGISPAAAQSPGSSVTARTSGSGQASTQAAAQDWTSFHSDSNAVRSLTSQALSSPAVRQGTVDALRQSVSSGQYKPDAGNIADGISSNRGG